MSCQHLLRGAMSSPSSAKIGVTVSLSAMMFVPGGGDGLWVKSAEVAMQREQSEAKDLLRAVVRQALQAVVSEGGGRTRGRLGADGVLRLPRGPLEASTHDEW